MENLPIEILEKILDLISYKDLKTLREVNSIFRFTDNFYKRTAKIVCSKAKDLRKALSFFSKVKEITFTGNYIHSSIYWREYTKLESQNVKDEFPRRMQDSIKKLKICNPTIINFRLLPNLEKLSIYYSRLPTVKTSKIIGVGKNITHLSIIHKENWRIFCIPSKKFPSLSVVKTDPSSQIIFQKTLATINESGVEEEVPFENDIKVYFNGPLCKPKKEGKGYNCYYYKK